MYDIHWMIQDRVFGDETIGLASCASSVTRCGSVRSRPPWPDPDISIFRGTIDFVQQYGGHCLTLENYQCSKYYQHVHNLLNDVFFIAPWWYLERHGAKIRETLGVSFERVFIRPNSGKKLFTGTTLSVRTFSTEMGIIRELPSSVDFPDDELVLVSPAKKIQRECRVLVHRNKAIDYAFYSGQQRTGDWTDIKHHVSRNSYFPDPLFTIDLADVGHGLTRIVEINSFVSAGLYDMNYSKVVPAVEEAWRKEYGE